MAHETLRRISRVYSPAAKLNILHATFSRTNEAIVAFSAGKTRLGSMDTVFPVFLSVVVRAQIEHLGAEIQFMEDFVDMDSISGESKILLTTLRAAYCQIIKDFETDFM